MRLRRLTEREAALADRVFGPALDVLRVWVLTGAPTGRWAMAIGPLLVFPAKIADFAAAPPPLRAWFVHELTHAWQLQTRPLRTLLSWLRVLLTGGYIGGQGYRYALPARWDRLNLEQQACVVEHAFLLSLGVRSDALPAGAGAADLPHPFPALRESP